MKHTRKFLPVVPMLVLVLACMVVPNAKAAFLPGTTPVAAGSSVPLLLPANNSAALTGTLLAGVISPAFQIKNAQNIVVASGILSAAVYKNSSGTLDFYYQVTNNSSTAPGACSTPPCDPIARETNFNFLLSLPEWLTAVGFRTDGGTAPLPGFVAGTIAPSFGDRSASGDTVGFQFGTTGTAIPPGATSSVLLISTDATNFTQGSSNVIDGGVGTVLTYQPLPPAPSVPEPASVMLLGGGLLVFAGISRFRRT